MKISLIFSALLSTVMLIATTSPSQAEPPGYRHHHADVSVAVSVQRRLARLGYYHGAIDGEIGPHSHTAIRRYQLDHGLPATGDIDRPLLRSLGI